MSDKTHSGFTIVELLVVIVVIGILASITIVSYSGISGRAKAASLQSDLANASKQIKLFQVASPTNSYPAANNCPTPGVTEICLKSSTDTTLTYQVNNTGIPQSFAVKAENGATSYIINNNSSPAVISASPSLNCPAGFIPVPGSLTYGTADFCVMKYEAKADANGDGIGDTTYTTGYNTWPADTQPISASTKLVSSAAGYPIANITQTISIAAASNPDFVYGCTSGCHLITEAEWMTIAQNVLSVPSNWSSNSVGTGYIYSGHNDNSPAAASVADASDANGYAGTNGNFAGDASIANGVVGNAQRRTLTLTNGEVIWDLAGNIWEWASGQMVGGQPSGMPSWNYYEWTALSGGSFMVNPFPSGTGIAGSNSWNSTNGIGRIFGRTSETTLHAFGRSHCWVGGINAGVLMMYAGGTPEGSGYGHGLRVSR